MSTERHEQHLSIFKREQTKLLHRQPNPTKHPETNLTFKTIHLDALVISPPPYNLNRMIPAWTQFCWRRLLKQLCARWGEGETSCLGEVGKKPKHLTNNSGRDKNLYVGQSRVQRAANEYMHKDDCPDVYMTAGLGPIERRKTSWMVCFSKSA